jgi:Cft2 family RNA processing exonuclease
MDYKDLDAIIIESTYANEDHTPRLNLKKALLKQPQTPLNGAETVLIPAFGVGRAQEIASVLVANHFEYPIVLDGMAREASRIILNYKEFLTRP